MIQTNLDILITDGSPTHAHAGSLMGMACAEDDERALQERKKSGYLGFDPDGGDGDGWGGRVSALSPPLGHQPWVASPAVRRTEEKARTRGGEGRPSASATRPCPARGDAGGAGRASTGAERERERWAWEFGWESGCEGNTGREGFGQECKLVDKYSIRPKI